MSRISCPVLAAKVAAAKEAVPYIHHGDNVGFSGFTGAGYPKAVPAVLAKAIVQAHGDGREFQVGLWTGASTAPDADGVLAAAHGISTRLPYNPMATRSSTTAAVAALNLLNPKIPHHQPSRHTLSLRDRHSGRMGEVCTPVDSPREPRGPRGLGRNTVMSFAGKAHGLFKTALRTLHFAFLGLIFAGEREALICTGCPTLARAGVIPQAMLSEGVQGRAYSRGWCSSTAVMASPGDPGCGAERRYPLIPWLDAQLVQKSADALSNLGSNRSHCVLESVRAMGCHRPKESQ